MTETGKTSVEANLSNWSYSRAIIDKLMDCSPAPIYQTKIVEKIVEVPVEVPAKPQIIESAQKQENDAILQATRDSSDNKEIATVNADKNTEENSQTSKSDVQEINFRNILNGLIKSSNTTQTTEKNVENEDLAPIERIQNNVEKQKFNETISSSDYNAQKSSNTGKIDFGDLTIKAAKEGYKLRISSKESAAPTGNVFINKINVCAALATYLIVMLEFLFFSLRFKAVLNPSPIVTVILAVALTIFPVCEVIRFYKYPNKKVSGNVSPDSISTAAIIVFNLLFITLAVNLLANVNFSDTFTILLSFVIPCVLFTDVLIYYVSRFNIAKCKVFNAKPNKKKF